MMPAAEVVARLRAKTAEGEDVITALLRDTARYITGVAPEDNPD